MKYNMIAALVIAGFTVSGIAAPAMTSQIDKVSYSVGYEIGKGFKTQALPIEGPQFNTGFQTGLSGTTPVMTEAEMQTTLANFQKEMMQEVMAKQQAAAATNLVASQAYLKKISAEAGVQQIEPGLYYKVVKAGNGPMPLATDTVTVNYEGSLINGTVFDSSYQRGQPASFQVSQVIPGWSKVLEQMPVGSTWMIYMSPDLAYGVSAPPQIGPNQALTFKIQLISTQKAAAQSNS